MATSYSYSYSPGGYSYVPGGYSYVPGGYSYVPGGYSGVAGGGYSYVAGRLQLRAGRLQLRPRRLQLRAGRLQLRPRRLQLQPWRRLQLQLRLYGLSYLTWPGAATPLARFPFDKVARLSRNLPQRSRTLPTCSRAPAGYDPSGVGPAPNPPSGAGPHASQSWDGFFSSPRRRRPAVYEHSRCRKADGNERGADKAGSARACLHALLASLDVSAERGVRPG